MRYICSAAIRFVLSDLFQNLRSEDRHALLHVSVIIVSCIFKLPDRVLILISTHFKISLSETLLLNRKVQGTKFYLLLWRLCSIIMTIAFRYVLALFFSPGSSGWEFRSFNLDSGRLMFYNICESSFRRQACGLFVIVVIMTQISFLQSGWYTIIFPLSSHFFWVRKLGKEKDKY